MRYDPGGQRIQLLHLLLQFLHATLAALDVFFRTQYMVCRQQKRRICCAALLGSGLVIIYSFSRMLLVSCLTLKSKLPGVCYRVPELLTGRLETAFQEMIGSRASMRLHEPLPMGHSRP